MDLSPHALSRSWRYGVLAVAGAGASVAACSLILPLDDQQCSVAADCAARGGAFTNAACVNHVCVPASTMSDAGVGDGGIPPDADPWGCLDNPPEVLDPSETVKVTFTTFDALSPITTAGDQGGDDFTVINCTPVPGISLQACNALDPDCANPLPNPVAVTDDAGIATVTVPATFAGFYLFNGPGYLTARVYTGQLLPGAKTFSPPSALLGTQETSLLAQAIGVPISLDPDGGVGHAFFQSYDCFDRHAAGVSFSISSDAGPQTVQWYAKNQLPSRTSGQTDSLGAGGTVNVPIGAMIVTATVVATNRKLGEVNTVITPAGTTFAWFRVRTH